MSPLEAVHGTEVADFAVRKTDFVEVFAGAIAIPDFDPGFAEGQGGGRAGDEPEEFGEDGAQEDALGGEEGEDRGVFFDSGGRVGGGFGEREAHLWRGEDRAGSGARAVGAVLAFAEDAADQV